MSIAVLIVVGFLMAAFFSGSETALVSINWIRLDHWLERGRRSAKVLEGFVRVNDRIFGQTMKHRRAMAMTRGVVELISALGIVAVILVGGYLLISEKLKVESVVMLVLAAWFFWQGWQRW